ncbi:glutathione S-transferase family protein [Peteryoungia ipomoeae]|uniref:Glutathione S-transferase family protein n=1 Tax=Peteryoungia ipomoeae TaxID=1210932 RepID=A0A4S8P3M2_9HYPH|nr:glutathione S-transferase family protein [Peteryoungia ipomoeae]THV22249.1 glutathione S-transferase family protein [Peteryoungia ipomoeae]
MASDTEHYRLYGAPGWGSVLVEAALVQADLDFTFENVEGFDQPGAVRDRLLAVNPLAQVPVLVLPDGATMTESAAILFYLAETHPDAGLAPAIDDPKRPAFLHRLVWLVAAVYATFTYADYPERWAPSAPEELKDRVMARRKLLWQQWETQVQPSPWALGEQFSALDICVCAMSRWQPGRDWMAAHCPKLMSIALKADEEPDLAAVWQRNFPD